MELVLQSSLEKIFPVKGPVGKEFTTASCLLGERFNFQLAVKGEGARRSRQPLELVVKGDAMVRLYAVKCMPSMLAVYDGEGDDNYLSKEPGIFPDLLEPLENSMMVMGGQWRSLWLEVIPNSPGPVEIEISLGEQKKKFSLQVLNARLPEQKLIYTQWFYCDCIADYYKVPVFSERHWELVEGYVRNAAEYGMNMLYVPVFTPPLDTPVGGERPTVQLVDIQAQKDGYSFGYEKLDRFIEMAQRAGIGYFEIAHPFTQWGAECAPKIMVSRDGKLVQEFGWDTKASSPEYAAFIQAFMRELKEYLKKKGVFEHTYFHVSDEPEIYHIESFQAACDVVKDVYADCNVIDALSEYAFYEKGLVKKPVPANDAIGPFLENGVPGLWAYYCCCQTNKVSNRLFAMPSARNRILGMQLFKYQLEGFLHWGYNSWYAQLSQGLIDPYAVTDASEAFPSGDAFSVYPGADGTPLPSLRQLVFLEGLQDMRALELLAALTSHEKVACLLDEWAGKPISFDEYPAPADFILETREKINRMILQEMGQK